MDTNEIAERILSRVDTEITRQIIREVILGDEYKLQDHKKSGANVQFVVDVGAHYGAFTLLAKSLWPHAGVLAFEPSPIAQSEFVENTAGLDHVELIRAAAMQRGCPKVAPLLLGSDGHDASNAVVMTSDTRFNMHELEQGSQSSVEVPCISLLDELIRRGRPNISILKLDCEGAEGGLLTDLSQDGYLRHIDCIVGEWHGTEMLPVIQESLGYTHVITLHPSQHSHGLFFAVALSGTVRHPAWSVKR